MYANKKPRRDATRVAAFIDVEFNSARITRAKPEIAYARVNTRARAQVSLDWSENCRDYRRFSC